jgi:hypothetical protein
MGHSEIPVGHLLGIRPFLVADDHDRPAIKFGHPSDDGRIIPISPVSVKLEKVIKHPLDIVGSLRPVDMTGQLRHLPAGEIGEDLLLETMKFLFQVFDLFIEMDLPALREPF